MSALARLVRACPRAVGPVVLLVAALAACKLSLDNATCPCTTGWVCCADRNVCVREDSEQCAADSDAGVDPDAGDETGVPPLFQRLVLDDAAAADRFGEDVALSGAVAAVGIPGRRTAALGAGAVAVFERRGSGHGAWVRLQELVAPDPSSNAQFGYTVAFSAGALLVGAPGAASGKVYVYRPTAGRWVWAQTIEPDLTGVPDNKRASLRFGNAMAADADRVIIATDGLPADVYQITGDGAVHLARLDPPSPPAVEPELGADVAIHGSTVAVTSLDLSSQLYVAHIFDGAQGWARTTLATDLGSATGGLQAQIAFDGQRLAVAYGPTISIWARTADGWGAAQHATLDPRVLGAMDLAWRGDALMVTSYRPSGTPTAEAFALQAFTLVGGTWQSGPINTRIGQRGGGATTSSLAVDDDWVLVGTPSTETAGSGAGAATFVRMDGEVFADLRLVTLDEGKLGTRLAAGGAQLLTDGAAGIAGGIDGSLTWFGKDADGQYRRRPSLTAGDVRFGDAAAVAGTHAMVSSVATDFGVQTFELGDRDWIAGDRLTSPDGGIASQGFGNLIAMEGDTAVIAGQLGSALVYQWTAAGWTLSASLANTRCASSVRYVGLSGSRILLSCADADSLALFEDGPTGWQPASVPSVPEAVTVQGMVSTLLSGDRIAIAAVAKADRHGISYVFRRVDGSWKLELARRTDAEVSSSNLCSGDCGFGVLALSGDRLIVAGAPGALIGYRAGAIGWVEDRSFVLPPGQRPVDARAKLVALTDDQVIAAVPDEAGRNQLRAGALYVFPWK